MGQGNQERFDLYAGKVGGQRENALQNGPTLNQAAGAGLAFLVPLLVLQNLLAILKLPNLLQDFLPFFFLGVGCNFFVHVRHLFSLEILID